MPEEAPRRISIVGVIAGGTVDLLLTGLAFTPLRLYAIRVAGLQKTPSEELARAVTIAIHSRPELYAIALVVGTLCTVLGGYVAARIAKRDPALNGFFAALFSVLAVAFAATSGKDPTGLFERFLMECLTLAAGLCGGLLRAAQLQRRTPPDPSTS